MLYFTLRYSVFLTCDFQKFFTDNNIMSRRSAEKVIEAGNVKINGVTAKLGDKIDPESDIETINIELALADYDTVEKRYQKQSLKSLYPTLLPTI